MASRKKAFLAFLGLSRAGKHHQNMAFSPEKSEKSQKKPTSKTSAIIGYGSRSFSEKTGKTQKKPTSKTSATIGYGSRSFSEKTEKTQKKPTSKTFCNHRIPVAFVFRKNRKKHTKNRLPELLQSSDSLRVRFPKKGKNRDFRKFSEKWQKSHFCHF